MSETLAIGIFFQLPADLGCGPMPVETFGLDTAGYKILASSLSGMRGIKVPR
jgi:hypothetical protein